MPIIRLLLIERDRDLAERVQQSLATDPTLSMTRTDTLEAAGQFLESGAFDVVIADVGVASDTSISAITELRGINKRVALIVLVDNASPRMVVEALRRGVQEMVAASEIESALEQAVLAAIERARMHAEFEEETRRDPLTGLLKRGEFFEAVDAAIARGNGASVFYVDLDHFKAANDTFGHKIGDLLLTRASERMVMSVRAADIVARLSGDEFAILTPRPLLHTTASSIADRVIDSLKKPFNIDGHTVEIGASIGSSTWPRDGESAEELVNAADSAMYAAKVAGGGRWIPFARSPRPRTVVNVDDAIKNHKLELHYQPVFSLRDNSISEIEALVRYRIGQDCVLEPSDFLHELEQSSEVRDAARWMFYRACTDLAKLRPQHPSIRVSMNLLRLPFADGEIRNILADATARSGLRPEDITVEIKESQVLRNLDAAKQLLREIRDLGARIVMDDFGSGTASLTLLRAIPLDAVKVDRSLLLSAIADEMDDRLLDAVIAAARSFRLRVIAEGVETWDQLRHARKVGFDLVQGYLLAKPRPLSGNRLTLSGGMSPES